MGFRDYSGTCDHDSKGRDDDSCTRFGYNYCYDSKCYSLSVYTALVAAEEEEDTDTDEPEDECVDADDSGGDCKTGETCDQVWWSFENEDGAMVATQVWKCFVYDFFEDAEPGDSELSVITAQDSDNIDEFDLYGDSLNFDWDTGDIVGNVDEYLSDGSIAIIREEFVDGFNNAVTLYYTEGASDPTVTYDEDDSTLATVVYSDNDATAIISRLGSDILDEGEEEEDEEGSNLLAAVEDGITAKIEDMLLTTVKPQYSFKKVKFEGISYSSLSSYEETEATQATGTSLSTTTGYGGTSGISEDY